MKLMTILTLLVFLPPADFGQQQRKLDGNELLPECKAAVRLMDKEDKATDDAADMQYCVGLVTGVSDMIELCGNTTYGQRIRIVVKYLEEHPEKLSVRATLLVKQALLDSLGCKARQSAH